MNGIEETGFIVIGCSRTPIAALKQVKNGHRYFSKIHMTVQRAFIEWSIIVIGVAVLS